MDALSEALAAVRTTGAIFFQVDCTAPWGFAVPNVNDAAHLLSPGTERLVNYHLVTKGRALVRIDGGDEFWVEAGDIVVLPHGDAHTVSNGQVDAFADSTRVLDTALIGHPVTLKLGGGGETTRIVCGFFGCERSVDRLFLAGLPQSLKISLREGPSGDWLAGTIEHLVSEAEADRPGATILLSRLAEALFVEALRRYMQNVPAGQMGWLAAARDPLVGAALALLHRRPGDPWTVDRLARAAGASRSVLTRRFAFLLQETPMGYLRRWRLHLAAGRLRTSHEAILHVAADVGYESESAFNRAFKAEFGLPPAQYRRGLCGARKGVRES